MEYNKNRVDINFVTLVASWLHFRLKLVNYDFMHILSILRRSGFHNPFLLEITLL